MANQSMMSVVAELMSEGHTIDFYIRKDGGILIKTIDGEHFKGAKGNTRARQLAGVQISEARFQQLKYATTTRAAYRKLKKEVSMDDQIEKEYARVKKMCDKAFKAKGGKPHPAGYFGKTRILDSIKKYGKAEALRRIQEAERYSTGLAYSKNVKILAIHIQNAALASDSRELAKLAEDVEKFAYMIREEWIEPAYNALYKLNKGQPAEEVARKVRAILRLEDK